MMFFLILAFSPADIPAVPEARPVVRGIYLSPGVIYKKKGLDDFFRMVDLGLVNAAVLDVKDERGKTRFSLYKKFIKEARKKGVYLIARQCIFKDEGLALKDAGALALKDLSGNIWFQEKDGYWVDPSLLEVRQYNVSITEKAFQAGFDEVQFDYIRYPSGNKLYKNSKNKLDNIVKFLDIVEKVKPEGKRISLTFYGYTVWNNILFREGQKFEEMAERVDAIYPMLYPSHFHDYFMADSTKESRTYSLIYESVEKARERLPEKNVEIIPYLQSFSWKKSRLGKKYVLNQLIAASDSHSDGFILWNAGGNYKNGYKELIEFDLYFFKKKLISRLFERRYDGQRNKEDPRG
jgi:hypothetical protein